MSTLDLTRVEPSRRYIGFVSLGTVPDRWSMGSCGWLSAPWPDNDLWFGDADSLSEANRCGFSRCHQCCPPYGSVGERSVPPHAGTAPLASGLSHRAWARGVHHAVQ